MQMDPNDMRDSAEGEDMAAQSDEEKATHQSEGKSEREDEEGGPGGNALDVGPQESGGYSDSTGGSPAM
jgi:hypothetical protein